MRNRHRWLTGLIAVGLLAPLASAAHADRHPGDPAATPSGDSARVVVVKMIGDAESFRFEPARFEVRRGDIVRFVHTGEMLHNVHFVTGKIPAGADLRDYKLTPFLPDHGTEYDMKIDARFLEGAYTFVCVPHEPWDMRGEMIVKP